MTLQKRIAWIWFSNKKENIFFKNITNLMTHRNNPNISICVQYALLHLCSNT